MVEWQLPNGSTIKFGEPPDYEGFTGDDINILYLDNEGDEEKYPPDFDEKVLEDTTEELPDEDVSLPDSELVEDEPDSELPAGEDTGNES